MNKLIILLLLFSILLFQVYGDDQIMLERDNLDYTVNPLIATSSDRISMVFPALLLIVAVISFVLDFGCVGVVIGCMGSMVLLWALLILNISLFSVTSFVLMGAILAYKLRG